MNSATSFPSVSAFYAISAHTWRKIRKSFILTQSLNHAWCVQPQYGHRPIKCYWESSPNAKLAARIILSAPRTSQRTVTLFNNKIYLWWLPFYNRCALVFRRINGTLPHYLNTSLRKNSDNNARITRNCNLNLLSPLHKNISEGILLHSRF